MLGRSRVTHLRSILNSDVEYFVGRSQGGEPHPTMDRKRRGGRVRERQINNRDCLITIPGLAWAISTSSSARDQRRRRCDRVLGRTELSFPQSVKGFLSCPTLLFGVSARTFQGWGNVGGKTRTRDAGRGGSFTLFLSPTL